MESIYNVHIAEGYRPLTPNEKKIQFEAIDWLHKKKIPIAEIAELKTKRVDVEGKRILFRWEGKRVKHVRIVKYEGTIFEKYVDEVFPGLKNTMFVFPSSVSLAGKGMPFPVRPTSLNEYYRSKRLFLFQNKSGIMDLSEFTSCTLETRMLERS